MPFMTIVGNADALVKIETRDRGGRTRDNDTRRAASGFAGSIYTSSFVITFLEPLTNLDEEFGWSVVESSSTCAVPPGIR